MWSFALSDRHGLEHSIYDCFEGWPRAWGQCIRVTPAGRDLLEQPSVHPLPKAGTALGPDQTSQGFSPGGSWKPPKMEPVQPLWKTSYITFLFEYLCGEDLSLCQQNCQWFALCPLWHNVPRLGVGTNSMAKAVGGYKVCLKIKGLTFVRSAALANKQTEVKLHEMCHGSEQREYKEKM